jgi:hypothetical protein
MPSIDFKFDELVDFKFEKFIAQKVMRVLYAIVFALLSLYVVVGVIAVIIAFRDSGTPLLALLAVAGVIVFYFLSLLFTRVWYESMIIRFQMAEDIREIRKKYLA